MTGYIEAAFWCGYIAGSMDAIDRGWDEITAPGESSDGLVQGSSQIYPFASRQYPIHDADSHVGETRSDKVRPVLFDALDEDFFLVPVQ